MNNSNLNYYQILDIEPKASYLEIRKKYLYLALKYHPDRNRHLGHNEYLENEEKFKLITIAFNTLSDPIEREKYDQSHPKSFFYSYHNHNFNFTVSSVFLNLASKLFSEEKIQAGQDFYNTFMKFVKINKSTPENNNQESNQQHQSSQHHQQSQNHQQYNQPNINISEAMMHFRNFLIKKNLEREKEMKCNTNTEYHKENVTEPENVNTNTNENTNSSNNMNSSINPNLNPNQNTNPNPNNLINQSVVSSRKRMYSSDSNSILSVSKTKSINNSNKESNNKNDLVYNINVSLADIYNEVPKELNIPRLRVCNMCLGRGYLGFGVNMSLCHICKGIMKIIDNKLFPIDIREKRLYFKGEGNQSITKKSESESDFDSEAEYNNNSLDNIEEPNDLIINIHSKPDSRFERINDYDLLYSHNVSLLDLYTEINILFEHLDNRKYLIKYSDNDDSINKIIHKMMISVPNLGLPIGSSGNRGILFIKLIVILPELSKSEINKLKLMNAFSSNIEYDNESDIKNKYNKSNYDILINLTSSSN
jgi:DnaJ-class molecular chaperone